MGSRSSPGGSGPSAGSRTKVKPLGRRERTSAPYALLGCTLSRLQENNKKREKGGNGKRVGGREGVKGYRGVI
jgi:hypothetical protein